MEMVYLLNGSESGGGGGGSGTVVPARYRIIDKDVEEISPERSELAEGKSLEG